MICDSFVKPATLVRICDECNYGSHAGRCVVCGGIGVADAYYCKECTSLEKDVCVCMCVLCMVLRGQSYQKYLLLPLSYEYHISIKNMIACVWVQRDGCPKIINLGSARMDLYFDRKKYK